MNVHKRFGAEGVQGLGGGMVSAASQQNLQKAEDLCRKGRPRDAVPFLMLALEDENNLDADIQMAFLSPNKPAVVEVLENAEVKGRRLLKRRLGPNTFSDDGPHVGNFGMIVETRPYMRVLQALVRMYFENGKYTKSTETMIEMMRLCPADNMNQRSWLGSMLLRVGRHADALYFAQVWIDADEGDGTPPLRGGTAFQAPHRELCSEAREKALSDPYFSPAVLLHTAALAAFHLWGACPQAAQYLRLAARANPHILVKILGRRSAPDEMNMLPRGINGPEEAQDYRWLTQDLWTEARVWGWITSDPVINRELLKICSRPDCTAQETRPTQFKQCAACHQVTYCAQTCQKSDWKRHRAECQEHQRIKKTIKNFDQGKPNTTNVPIISTDFPVGGPPVAFDGTKFL
ncbi:hypothetical protein B0H15DRAFT_169521 [Mycena belliarum]|uniref:MYND-type domain-containing protein n=1 Tax=Mycena belliarum TaxID=1033014 RepID=A0AAD6XTT4_9AGAR|nr:hypothetical protein B0H15DRAFT_169521 [Mycena belliae]